MRLRQRLLLFCAVLISAPAMTSFATFFLMSRSAVPEMRASVEHRTRIELERLVHTAAAPLAAADTAQLERSLIDLARDRGLVWAVITDEAGRIRATWGIAPEIPPISSKRVSIDDESVVGWAPIDLEGARIGHVGVGYSMTVAERVHDWSSLLGIVTIVVAVGGIGFAIAFARRFVKPIEEMKQFAAAVTAGDLSRRIASRDASELGELARHLDAMTEALQLREGDLANHRARLEQALAEIRSTQDELMRSSRLAAVGEMAGRTAHEVLNPAQSLQGRLVRMSSEDLSTARDNADVLAAIVEAWRTEAAAGPEGLLRTLSERVGDQTVLAADLDALDQLVTWFREACDRADRDFEFLQKELGRITRIVDSMRSMSRQRSSLAVHALSPLLVESSEIVRDACAKRAIRIETRCPANLEVEIDRYELLQVLTNLLRNAMLAIEQRSGSRGGKIAIEATTDEHLATIRVIDDGTGITEEHLPQIFEQSFTTRAASEGTGLGLSISRRLIRQMGGELEVERTVLGLGTTFRITLPVTTHSQELPRDHVAA